MRLFASQRLLADEQNYTSLLDQVTGFKWTKTGNHWTTAGDDLRSLIEKIDLKNKDSYWLSGDPRLTVIDKKAVKYFCVRFDDSFTKAQGFVHEVKT